MVPEAKSAEEAADKAVLPSTLGRGCRQAGWIQHLFDSGAVLQLPDHLPPSILLKQEKKSLEKLALFFSPAPFFLSTRKFLVFFY